MLGRYQGVQVRSRGVLAAPAQVQCCAHTPKTAPRRRIAPQAVSAPPSSSSISKVFDTSVEDAEFLDPERPMKVLIAGGGIAGLVLAVALLKKGVDVRIFEQDMTAIRGEGKYRGPIQVRFYHRLHTAHSCGVNRVHSPTYTLGQCCILSDDRLW